MTCSVWLRFAITGMVALASSAAVGQGSLPANATVYASGLQGPRGMAFGPDGALYVAEAGLGGTLKTVGVCTQVPAPVGPWAGGPTARISKVVNGTVTTVATGFPSTSSDAGGVIGVADVAFLDGQLYGLVAGGGCSHGNPNQPNGVVKVNLKTGKWQYIADLSAFTMEHPGTYNTYNDFEPDDVPYSMTVENGRFFVAEPNHAQIFAVSPGGATHLVYDYSLHFADVTPTSIAFSNQNMYVGNLNIFPIRPNTARVVTLSKNIGFIDTTPGFETKPADLSKYRLAASRAGFATIVSLKFGPDGLLYVLELSNPEGDPNPTGYPTPGEGKVVRINAAGKIEDVVTGLTVPTGMVFGPDHALYISNVGGANAGAPGQILRVANP